MFSVHLNATFDDKDKDENGHRKMYDSIPSNSPAVTIPKES